MSSYMMDRPMLISSMMEFGVNDHPNAEIITRRVEDGKIVRHTQREAAERAAQVAHALDGLGIKFGDRVATLAWNTHRHYEIYFGVCGIGAVCHTINPRLFPEQIDYIVNHAEDRVLFVDLTFLPLVEAIADKLSVLETIVILADKDAMPETKLPNVVCYEELIAGEKTSYDWPEFDENSGASLCYTSGTTGNPKGVMYTHRSTVLHAGFSLHKQCFDMSRDTVVLPVVPMFHVNCWGIPFSVAVTGATLVFPGAGMDGASLWELIDQEKPDLLAGVPTVWLGLLNHLDSIGATLDSVENVVVGGSAAPISMIQAFDEKHGAFLVHAWGMTEMSPIGSVNVATDEIRALPAAERYKIQSSQGRPPYGVDLKIVDDEGNELPRDGKAFGRLLVRGPWIIQRYYKADTDAVEADGWFDTGDVATIDPQNYMRIVDRSKDVIKSGGEWISSIDLENIAVGHPAVLEACVIGVPEERWQERPLLLCVLHEGKTATKQDILDFLEPQIAKFWTPDDVIFRTDLPHGATGKLLKVPLREEYQDHLMK